MGATIPDGQYYGDLTRTQRIADLVLSETRYARGAIVPGHAHASPLWCLVLSGRLVEQSRGTTRTLGPGWVLLHPEDEPHAHRFESARTRCFTVQLDPAGWPRLRRNGSASGGRGGSRGTDCVAGAAALRGVQPG